MFEYSIKYLNAAGKLALQFVTCCTDDGHAHQVAEKHFTGEFSRFEIWHEGKCIEVGAHLEAVA